MVGKVYGKYTVIKKAKSRLDNKRNLRPYWVCRCSGCSKLYEVGQYDLVSGRSTQCKYCARKGLYRG